MSTTVAPSLGMTAAVNSSGKAQQASSSNGSSLPVYTMKDVATHNTKTDCWIVIRDRVYDVSRFIDKHPGGGHMITAFAGMDATDEVEQMHKEDVIARWLPSFHIGFVSNPPEPNQVQKDFRALYQKYKSMGYFEADMPFYYREFAFHALLLLLALYLSMFATFPYADWFGAACLGIFFQQAAFVGHDLGHMSVTNDRMADVYIGIIYGNLLTGISIGWWKDTHNHHHAVPNSVHDDPDIAHLPFLCYDSKFFNSVYSNYHKRILEFDAFAQKVLVPYQHILFYIIMAVARFNLYAESIKRLIINPHAQFKVAEWVTLALFHTWMFSLCFYNRTFLQGLGYLLLSTAVSGILEVQILLNHSSRPTNYGRQGKEGEEVYAGDFYTRQVVTAMDVDCYEWMDWFHGGLHMQTLHHTFPRMPRTKLRVGMPEFIELCNKHKLPYKAVSFFEANYEIISHLKKVGKEATQWSPIIKDGLNARG